MDRSWMYEINRAGDEYRTRVTEEFIKCAMEHAKKKGDSLMLCPCVDCDNLKKVSSPEVCAGHLIVRGFKKDYTRWIWHGETLVDRTCEVEKGDNDEEGDNDVDCDMEENRMNDIMENVIRDFEDQPQVFESLLSDSEKPLYPGCDKKFTKLSGVLKLMSLKVESRWSDKSFSALLQLLGEMLPEGHELPKSTYEAKKMICPLGCDYEKIHACPNDCILYRNEYKDMDECPTCGTSRYLLKDNGIDEKKRSAAKVMWYLPPIPRFKCMFSNKKIAKNLRWHAEVRKNDDGMLRHPADSPQWRIIDRTFPEFGKEARNLRLGLCTDGMNPFATLRSTHSTWPVLLCIYNLPPYLCMKPKYIMLSLLIQGPKQPGNDIDVYLAPLIDDLKMLFTDGVSVFDAVDQDYFTLKAMIFCTINDFPAYGNLSGYAVKGEKACPICEKNTIAPWLTHCGKNVYMSHRRFLPLNHPYRRMKKPFNGKVETSVAPVALEGDEVYERVKDIATVYGKPNKFPKKALYKKKSPLWDLPYWKHLDVRHCIDIMHVEKNVCDSLIGTLLNIPGKTKDSYKARKDIEDMGTRNELAPQEKGKRRYLPPACYTLSKKEPIYKRLNVDLTDHSRTSVCRFATMAEDRDDGAMSEQEREDIAMHEEEAANENLGQRPTKKSRGVTRLEKLENVKEPMVLEWDTDNCPIGKHAAVYASNVGSCTRSKVNINIDHWDNVQGGLKNLLWEDISKKFHIDEIRKPEVLKLCGRRWNNFKAKLCSTYIRGTHLKYKSPCELYSYITLADWEKFKVERTTNDFQTKSEKAKENQKLNDHPHKMGRSSYAQKKPEWITSHASQTSSSEDTSSQVYDRSWYWILARSKDGHIDNDKTRKVANDIVEWQKKVDSGEFVPNRHDDVLSRGLNKKEHPGQVRGVGGVVGIKRVFGKPEHRAPRGVISLDDFQKFAKRLEIDVTKKVTVEVTEKVTQETLASVDSYIQERTMSILKQMGVLIPNNIEVNSPPPRRQTQSSCHSVDPIANQDPFPEIEVPTQCQLATTYDEKLFVVALGTVYPPQATGNQVIHNMPLLPGHSKVSIDKVEEGQAPLPVPTPFHVTVLEAKASFVQWPQNLIILGEDPPSPKKGQDSSKGSRVKISRPSKDKGELEIERSGPTCQELYQLLKLMPPEAKLFYIEVAAETIFKYQKDERVYIHEQDMTELFRLAFLNISCIHSFMVFLEKSCIEEETTKEGENRRNHKNDKTKDDGHKNPSIGFLCPQRMSLIGSNKEAEMVAYIEYALLKMQFRDIILAPFFHKSHWMLAVICPANHMAFLYDSQRKQRDHGIKSRINVAFRCYRVQGGNSNKSGYQLTWHNIKCPQQLGSTECGYYVMRYMLDIIRYYRIKFDPKEWFGSENAYTMQQMNEVRDIWATYFMERFM